MLQFFLTIINSRHIILCSGRFLKVICAKTAYITQVFNKAFTFILHMEGSKIQMTVKGIETAHAMLKDVLHTVPLAASRTFTQMSGTQLYLKCENLQKTGSFKVRGAHNKITKLVREEGIKSVVASSAGNHAQGVAFSANALGISSTIVMPLNTPIAKISATRGYGAEIVLHGSCFDDAYEKAREIQRETGAAFVHAFDDEDVITGQATVAIEILKDLPDTGTVLVPAGGGGLLAGIAFYLKSVNPSIKVIGVQSAGADAIVRSFRAGSTVVSDTVQTIADGIAVKAPGAIPLDYIGKYVDEMVTVSDAEIAECILLLLERNKLVAEPAGAAALAAAINNKVTFKGKNTVCVISGGNIDVSIMHKIVEKGLITRGRQMKFKTVLPDSPGSLVRFSSILASCGANILAMDHDRLNAGLGLNDAIVHIACEVSGKEHGADLLKRLTDGGYEVTMES